MRKRGLGRLRDGARKLWRVCDEVEGRRGYGTSARRCCLRSMRSQCLLGCSACTEPFRLTDALLRGLAWVRAPHLVRFEPQCGLGLRACRRVGGRHATSRGANGWVKAQGSCWQALPYGLRVRFLSQSTPLSVRAPARSHVTNRSAEALELEFADAIMSDAE